MNENQYGMDIVDYVQEHPYNQRNVQKTNQPPLISCFYFYRDYIYVGYDDGMICVFNKDGSLESLFAGHTERVNSI